MDISRDLLLERGYKEYQIKGQIVFVKGHHALIRLFGVWIPCYYDAGTFLTDRIWINNMEELDIIEKL